MMERAVLLTSFCLLAVNAEGQSRYRPQGGSAGSASGGFGGFGGSGSGGFSSSGSGGGFGGSGSGSFSNLLPVLQGAGGGSLDQAIPGTPGDDYPIYAEVPQTSFLCDGQIDGGYYADPEADCQVFHICTNDGEGGLTKYSFLCPNGTLFNQQYFICDWWFNVDCSLAESLYSRNAEVAAEREQYSGGAAGGNGGRPFTQGGGGSRPTSSGSRPFAGGSSSFGASGVRPGRPSGSGGFGGFSNPAIGSYGSPAGYVRSARNIEADGEVAEAVGNEEEAVELQTEE